MPDPATVILAVRYKDYIESADWTNRCVRFFGQTPMCAVVDCRRRWHEGRVQIHHRTYERLGSELMSDLVPLCDGHHTMAHKYARDIFEEGLLTKNEALWKGTVLVVGEPPSSAIASLEPEERAFLRAVMPKPELRRIGA